MIRWLLLGIRNTRRLLKYYDEWGLTINERKTLYLRVRGHEMEVLEYDQQETKNDAENISVWERR